VSTWGNLTRVFDRACAYYPDRTAVVEGDRRITYREMRDWTNRIAHGLAALGVAHGERVGMLLPNSLELVPTLFGIWRRGATLVQMPARSGIDDWRYFLRESHASTLIYHAQFDYAISKIRADLPELKHLVRLGSPEGDSAVEAADYDDVFSNQPTDDFSAMITPDDIAYVAFTSGTTGVPKGIIQSHRSWSHYVITAGLEIGDTRPGEVFAHVAPLTHFTQIFLVPTFMRGGTNVVLPGFDIEKFLTTIQQEKVTATAVVPTILYMLLDYPRLGDFDLSSLRTVVYAGSPMAPERLQQALEVFGPIFVQTYAGSEPGFTTCLRKEEHRVDSDEWIKRLSSAGRPMFHVDVSIQDEHDNILPPGEIGEICARQEGQMVSYLDPEKNAEAMRGGWVHSGDIGYVDEDGYVYIVDRKKDMIVTGGMNVFPRQIEDILQEHPAVAQCAVIGVPHEQWGEAVTAFVVRRDGATVTADELVAMVKERKGGAWAPKTVNFVDQLPLNASGKVDKKKLREPYWVGRTRQVS